MDHPNRPAPWRKQSMSALTNSETKRTSEPHRSDSSPIERRQFLRGVGITCAALAAGTGIASASADPRISFPDGTALVLENTRGPMEAAVRTKNVHMPDGGWVVISTDADASNIVGRSIERLPAGFFESLLVAVQAQEPGTHTLYATLFKGAKKTAFPGDGPLPYGPTQDDAEIEFS